MPSSTLPDPKDPPVEVARIRAKIKDFFDQEASNGRKIGSAICGVYAFFDYDGEPIYVGQSIEGLRGRVGRHLTGRRSDAVAKFVLDPFEVLEIEAWPVWDVQPGGGAAKADRKDKANRLEHTVYEQCLADSTFGAVLNEQEISPAPAIAVPPSYRATIIPADMYEERSHPDVRLARRAATIASLARLISERKVGRSLRATLLVQAQRLEHLAETRYGDFADDPIDVEDDHVEHDHVEDDD